MAVSLQKASEGLGEKSQFKVRLKPCLESWGGGAFVLPKLRGIANDKGFLNTERALNKTFIKGSPLGMPLCDTRTQKCSLWEWFIMLSVVFNETGRCSHDNIRIKMRRLKKLAFAITCKVEIFLETLQDLKAVLSFSASAACRLVTLYIRQTPTDHSCSKSCLFLQ